MFFEGGRLFSVVSTVYSFGITHSEYLTSSEIVSIDVTKAYYD